MSVAGAVVVVVLDGGRVVVVAPVVAGEVAGAGADAAGGGVDAGGGAATADVAVGGPVSDAEMFTAVATDPSASDDGVETAGATVSPEVGSVVGRTAMFDGTTIGTGSSTYTVTTVGSAGVVVAGAAAEATSTVGRPARMTLRLRPTATTTTTTRLSPETAAAVTWLRFTAPPSMHESGVARFGHHGTGTERQRNRNPTAKRSHPSSPSRRQV
jgi:hypothetical protein